MSIIGTREYLHKNIASEAAQFVFFSFAGEACNEVDLVSVWLSVGLSFF